MTGCRWGRIVGSEGVCALRPGKPTRSLAQSRNVGSNDPMASCGQDGEESRTPLEGQIWVLILPK